MGSAVGRELEGTTYAILPSARRPKLLVPIAGRLAAGSMRSYNDSMSQAARLRRAVMSGMFRTGMQRFMKLDKVAFMTNADGSPSLLEYLESVLHQPVDVSIAMVPIPRPNRKPVLQVLGSDGRPLAYAKVGWNDLTRRLVGNEVAALRTLASADLQTFSAPNVVHAGSWEGRSILITEAASSPLVRRCRRNAPPPIGVEREVSRSMWSDSEPLGSSRYLSDLDARIRGSLDDGTALRTRLESVIDRFRDTSVSFAFGAWHGDWAPWNMSRSPSGLVVWDWERFDGPVPFGFDRAHLHFQVDNMVHGRSVRDAAGTASAALAAVPEIRSMGSATARAILQLYLVEQVLRLEEGRSAGEAIRPGVVQAIVDHLEEVRVPR
jgi:hypothetical protein